MGCLYLDATSLIYLIFFSYDMYGDRSDMRSPELNEPPRTPLEDAVPEVEDGQALEVIELANGETIW